MKKITLLIALAFAVICSANADNKKNEKKMSKASTEKAVAIYSLSGKVYDSNDNEALSGASITVDGRKYYSDLSGNFNIPQLTKGKHTIAVDFISYQSQTMEIDLDKNENVNIAIKQL
ncbi:carboxypeptidase-like regulatory domain-containing protein [Phocaeicola sp.]|nr:carboxypeptidase-like regulatory domain-containing protein [Bacteroides sp.]